MSCSWETGVPCQGGHHRCHLPAAAALVGEREEVLDLERGLSWWRSHWTHRLPWGACSSAGRCARSEGSGRTWTAEAPSSLPQTAYTPSLQRKERSHPLLLLRTLQPPQAGRVLTLRIRVRPQHCQPDLAAGWEQQGFCAVVTGRSHSHSSTLQERIWISHPASQHTTNTTTGHKCTWQQRKKWVRSPNSYLRCLPHWHLAQIPLYVTHGNSESIAQQLMPKVTKNPK